MILSPELLASNLLSPVVLAFVLGLVARGLRSDLAIPPAIQSYLSIFLLLAIGLKGGAALRSTSFGDVVVLLGVTILAGIATCASAYALARIWLRDSRLEAGAIAAHFGSVSAVTFIAAQQFGERTGNSPEGVLVALVVALEIPAILLGLSLARRGEGLQWHSVREVLVGKTALLLIGGMVIGAVATREGNDAVNLMYGQLFQGTLMLFMLDMGMLAAGQLRGLGREGFRLSSYSMALPLLHGLGGTALGFAAGLSPAGAAVFGAMTSSASYIAAPASVRASLPDANVGRCISAALGITFPFNLAIGIPAYFAFAAWLAR
jgi:uncharacterized protein